MSTASDSANVAVVTAGALARVARFITEQLLQPRRSFLKHRAPKSSYVHRLRRDIAQGKARPIEMCLAISVADLQDGVPLSLVRQAYDSAISELEEIAAALGVAKRSPDLPLLPLLRRENAIQDEGDVVERELIANPESLEAIDRRIAISGRYEDAEDRLVTNLRARRARLTSGNTEMELAQ